MTVLRINGKPGEDISPGNTIKIMKDKDAKLMMEAYSEAQLREFEYRSGGSPHGSAERVIGDDVIQAKVAEVVKKYLSLDDNHPMSGDPTYVSSVLVDVEGLIDGTGDEDIRRHYEGWSNADLVEFTKQIRYKMEEYLLPDDLRYLGDPDEARRWRERRDKPQPATAAPSPDGSVPGYQPPVQPRTPVG